MMEKYANLSGRSGISEYLITPKSIRIKFIKRAEIYVYNYMKPGKVHVENMKNLALAGKNLSKYINRNIQRNYYSVE